PRTARRSTSAGRGLDGEGAPDRDGVSFAPRPGPGREGPGSPARPRRRFRCACAQIPPVAAADEARRLGSVEVRGDASGRDAERLRDLPGPRARVLAEVGGDVVLGYLAGRT